MELVRHIELYRSDRFFSAFPSLAILPSGDILLAFRRAPDHRWLFGEKRKSDFNSVDHVHFRSHIAALRLDPDLNVKDCVFSLPAHPEAADQDANLFVHSSGRLIQQGFLWYPVTAEVSARLKAVGKTVLTAEPLGAGYVFWGGYVRHSDDEGRTWSEHCDLPAVADSRGQGGPYVLGTAALRGRMIERPDGSLLLAGYTAGESDSDHQYTHLYESHDRGETWARLPNDIRMNAVSLQEPALVAWPAGRVTAFHRTNGNDDRLVIAEGSLDGNFGQPLTRQVVGHPYDPMVLSDGRLLLTYGYRHEPMGVRARIVSTLEELETAPEIIVRDDSPSRDTGYPSAVQLDKDHVLFAYYMADENGIRGIDGTIMRLT